MKQYPRSVNLRNIHRVGKEHHHASSLRWGVVITSAVIGLVCYAMVANSGSHSKVPTTLAEVLALPEKKLAEIDVALMNLLCAQDLPNSGTLNIDHCLTQLDAYTRRVAEETRRNYHRFRECPQEYENSEAFYRMGMLITVLQQDCGVRYNPARIESPSAPAANEIFFADAQDIFLHGLLGPRRMGTCASMPILYVAVARRLEYPVKLVTAKSHIFVRWESPDGKERLNIEGTNQGIRCEPDEYYKSWPMPISEAEIKTRHYLKSLTSKEELAVFLSLRGLCLQSAGRLADARQAFVYAHEYGPQLTSGLDQPFHLAVTAPPSTPLAASSLPDHGPLTHAEIDTLAVQAEALNQYNRDTMARRQAVTHPRFGPPNTR